MFSPTYLVLVLACLVVAIQAQDTEVTLDKTELTVTEGDEIMLMCTSSLGYDMDWDHNGLPLEDGTDRVIITVAESSGTKISAMTRTDSNWRDGGTYKCMDRADFFDIFVEAVVTVNKAEHGGSDAEGSSDMKIEPADDFTKEEGDSVTFSCKCEMGSEFTFFRDDTAISEKVGVTVTSMQNGPARTTLLTIDSVTTADSGTYTCKTASGGGTTDVTMTVNGDETDAGEDAEEGGDTEDKDDTDGGEHEDGDEEGHAGDDDDISSGRTALVSFTLLIFTMVPRWV